MAKELNQDEITSRELERLVSKVEQKALREQIQRAMAKLELHKSYGLRFEIILDFFAGSGTTFQAVAELNESDGGNRQCILVTNNESDICRDVTWERVKRVTTGTHKYDECIHKYNGNSTASATFYTMEIYSEDEIEKVSSGWKQKMEGYLPLLSTKLNLPHRWGKIPNAKGFYQDKTAIVEAHELDYDVQQLLKTNEYHTLAIVSDDKNEFELAKARCQKTTKIKCFIFLPKDYTNYFENFHTKE